MKFMRPRVWGIRQIFQRRQRLQEGGLLIYIMRGMKPYPRNRILSWCSCGLALLLCSACTGPSMDQVTALNVV